MKELKRKSQKDNKFNEVLNDHNHSVKSAMTEKKEKVFFLKAASSFDQLSDVASLA